MKRLCILGSTGSVGANTIRVVRSLPDRLRVVSLAAGRNVRRLAEQIAEFSPEVAAVASADLVEPLRNELQARGFRSRCRIVIGVEGQVEAATEPAVDLVVSASHGVTGLVATYRAILAGKRIALANKECLVAAGELMMKAAARANALVLPVDSEHSAIHQCVRSGRRPEIRRLILTGSGGPFLRTPRRELESVTPERALKHPVWKMGGRITVDSATLMNKGLEIVEAHWLFGLPSSQIEVVIHPESIVHSMIEFCDGSVMAQMAVPDMRIPIQYALTYPDRVNLNGGDLSLNLPSLRRLHFRQPDTKRFPCLDLGRQALERGGAAPCALNAADEVAVEAFLAGRIGFLDIPRVVDRVMSKASTQSLGSMEDVLAADSESRSRAAEEVATLSRWPAAAIAKGM